LKSQQFNKARNSKDKLDRALEFAQIQKLNSSAARDREEVRKSVESRFNPIKKI
jgi:hypothetical protein